MRIKLGSCPKCGGAQFLESDGYGKVWVCLPCGWRVPVKLGVDKPYLVKYT